ncbi:ribbon-helix-helix domain-containing protein [Bosea sp. F3-2]|uniref:ribbon-helix-helix domain-containing protein n=1 Tax=Bosea sp. F3-2 TaxID=2599640 RepID=UPI0011ED9C13|nr:ribbon-helix-helix domain-containing protein [Bosea sp. F3-2]QEL24125.1 ribbon-helix-helix domain-containing protein [Bosea sp. F3-2]
MEQVEDEADLRSVKEPRLRLLTISGRRRAFKLEPSFWRALEHMADQQRERLSTLVARLIAKDGGNATARLRVAAIEWYMREAQAGQPRNLKGRWQRIIDLMIEPAFIINQHKQILLFNGPMHTLVASTGVQSQLRLGLAAEIGRVLALFEENEQRILSIPGSLDAEHHSLKATVRVTLLERTRGQALLLCALRPTPPAP